MDYTEAVEADVSKQQFLLNTLFNLEDFPKDTALTEDDDFTYEAMKTTYQGSWNT